MIGWVILVIESQPKCKKGPLIHKKVNSYFWITFNFWWLAEQSEWQKSTKMQKRPSKSSKNEMLIFGIMFNFWWLAEWSEWQKSTAMQIKASLVIKKKFSFLDYFQLLMIGWAIWVTKVNHNAKKAPLSHQKMKCSFLDYVQLLMIGRVIWVMKVNQNAK